MAGNGPPGRERAQQVPQERHVEVMQGPPDREIVQLARGRRIKFVGLAYALHPTGHDMRCSRVAAAAAASATPQGRFKHAEWRGQAVQQLLWEGPVRENGSAYRTLPFTHAPHLPPCYRFA